MKTRLIAMIVLALVVLLALPSALNAQGTDPESVLKAICKVLEAKDVDQAVALLADDVVQTLIPPPAGGTGVYTGKEQMRTRFKEVIAVNPKHDFGDCRTQGDKVTCSVTYSDDGLKAMGVASIEMTAEATVQGGKLKAVNWTVTDESMAKLQAAIAALPETGGTGPSGTLPLWLGVGGLLTLALGLGLRRMS